MSTALAAPGLAFAIRQQMSRRVVLLLALLISSSFFVGATILAKAGETTCGAAQGYGPGHAGFDTAYAALFQNAPRIG